MSAINVIFDGPPSHESGRFIEVEDDSGRSIRVGEWIERDDGLWALRINHLPAIDTEAPGHTDLMVSPESLDEYLRDNPPPHDGEAREDTDE